MRHRRRRSYGRNNQRTIYRGRLPRTLPGIPAPSGLRGIRGPAQRAPVPAPATSGDRARTRPSRRGLGTATAYVAVGTLISRVTGLLRILVAIYALGYSTLSDSFNLANNTPNIVHDLVLGGILTATFVPVFVSRLATRSEQEAVDSISAVLTLAACLLLIATVVFFLAAPLIIDLYTVGSHGPGIVAERQVATYLLRLFSPQLLAYGAISLMTAVLNTARRFSAPAYAPVLNNIVAIGILLAFVAVGHTHNLAAVQHDHRLLLLLGIGTTLGVVIQAGALVPSLLGCGLRIRPRWSPSDPAVREIVNLSGWTFGFVIANQLAVFVVSAIAVNIGTASLTAYTYASIFFQLPFGIVAVSVMTTMAPVLASRFTKGDTAGFTQEFGLGLRRTMAGVIPAVVGYLLLAQPAISLISLGAGTAHHLSGAHLTATMLELLALGLPGFCTYLLAILAFQAMRDTRTPFFLYLLENGLNVLLAFGFRSTLGAKGLALSLSVAYTVSAVAALVVLRNRVGGLGGFAVGRYVSRTVICSLVMAFVVALVLAGVGSDQGIGLLVRVFASVLAGIITYGLAAGLAGTLVSWQTSRRRHAIAGKGRHGRNPSRHR
ncbi:MAG: murein biosynthesis integral membrane protein MurJ [Acidimicrobiales bacterium]